MARVLAREQLPQGSSTRDGRVRLDLLTDDVPLGAEALRADRIVYHPGDTAARHYPQAATTLSSASRAADFCTQAMRCHRLEPGGVIHVRAGEEHWAENDGEANFCFVELWAPPPEDTVWTEDDMAPGDAMPEPRAPERAGRLADLREPGPVRAGAFELDRLEVAPRQSREWRAHDGGEHLLQSFAGRVALDPGERAILIAGADGRRS